MGSTGDSGMEHSSKIFITMLYLRFSLCRDDHPLKLITLILAR